MPLFQAVNGVESSILLISQSLTGLEIRTKREAKAIQKRENVL